MGLTTGAIGVILAASTIILGFQGWPLERLWLYLVGSALLILIGLQLGISWIVMRTLEELSERDIRTRDDLSGGRQTAEPAAGSNRDKARR
jgi:hypothetical protein